MPVITVRIPPPPLGAKIGVTPDDGKHEILRKREAALRAWMDDEWDLVEVDGIRRPEASGRAPTAPSKSSRSSRTTDHPRRSRPPRARRAASRRLRRLTPPHAASDRLPPRRSRRAAPGARAEQKTGRHLHLRHLRTRRAAADGVAPWWAAPFEGVIIAPGEDPRDIILQWTYNKADHQRNLAARPIVDEDVGLAPGTPPPAARRPPRRLRPPPTPPPASARRRR